MLVGCQEATDTAVGPLLDPNDQNIVIALQSGRLIETKAYDAKDTVRLTGHISGVHKRTLNYLRASWISDKDGILGASPVDSNGDFELVDIEMSKQTHFITVEIDDGVNTISGGNTRVINGSQINYDNLEVGQKSIYAHSFIHETYTYTCDLEKKEFKELHAVEVTGQQGNVYTIAEYRLPDGYYWRQEYDLKIENDTLTYLSDHLVIMGHCCWDILEVPLHDIATNEIEAEDACDTYDFGDIDGRIYHAYSKNYQHNDINYTQVNLIQDRSRASTDGPIRTMAYHKSAGIITYSRVGYGGGVQLWELLF